RPSRGRRGFEHRPRRGRGPGRPWLLCPRRPPRATLITFADHLRATYARQYASAVRQDLRFYFRWLEARGSCPAGTAHLLDGRPRERKPKPVRPPRLPKPVRAPRFPRPKREARKLLLSGLSQETARTYMLSVRTLERALAREGKSLMGISR